MDQFYRFFKRNSLIKDGSTIVVGVSGGPDSLALLHLLSALKKKGSFRLVAAHLDHMFRGKQSENEKKFVQKYCQDRNIEVETAQVDVSQFAKEKKLSSQVAARECRYQFFKEIMDHYQGDFLALGHHGDDQIETILMRFVRGAAGRALAGMEEIRPFHTGYIIRPLLRVTKDDLLNYCNQHNLNPRFDPSNEKDDYTRNRFRKYVLPFLKEENPKVHERFQLFSENVLEDEAFLQELSMEKMNKVWNRKKDKESELEIKPFLKLPLSLQRRGIQLILNYLYKRVPSSLTSIHIESLLHLLSQKHPSGSLDLPNGLKAVKSYDNCLFTFAHKKEIEPYELELNPPKRIVLPNGAEISAHKGPFPKEYVNGNNFFIVKEERVTLPFIVRSRKSGDKLKVKGMNGTKKVKDIFIDEKTPLYERDEWPVVLDSSGQILWLPGLKKSSIEDFNVTNEEYIVLQYKKQAVVGGYSE
ncbi:tRNA lysidine(34) synthetase TilS [Metabacillus arenae]|uniref:tRNA(Ile)-lysidine synthase n=1 Tax=Metabacillus arenae TaxID=2771434 RepID=A0A926NKS7_9BACI|nr:tRNA lysidine(34) synthetase TilS [Metabacillus arenae]MBD1383186.1 tRNA lysidine(34) synthetase TilS [Metabacillus arenae]